MSDSPLLQKKQTYEIPEISLNEVITFLKKYTLIVGAVGFICCVLGYLSSFLMPVSYKSQLVILPEAGSGSGGLGSLAGLARLGGISNQDNLGSIPPDLYPTILHSMPFALYMAKQPVIDMNNKSYPSLEKFLNKGESPDSISGSQVAKQVSHQIGKDILSLSRDEEKTAGKILGLINTTYEVKNGVIIIDAEMSDPVVAALSVEIASNYLIKYISEYRTGKATQQVEFLGQRAQEAKKREHDAEYALQSYRDRNRSAFLNVARIEEQRLQADYTLAQSLYGDIARRWEDAKLKVKQDQPVIKILEPAKVPHATSKPRRLVIALISGIVGATITLLLILFVKKI